MIALSAAKSDATIEYTIVDNIVGVGMIRILNRPLVLSEY
jgi:hypothetical protein